MASDRSIADQEKAAMEAAIENGWREFRKTLPLCSPQALASMHEAFRYGFACGGEYELAQTGGTAAVTRGLV